MKSFIHKYLPLICAMVISMPALSAKLPDYYPEVFDRWGVIDQIDMDKQTIVVNDLNIHTVRDLHVYMVNTRFATAQSLQPGMKIGFGTTGSRALSGTVTEVWVLPADYTPSRSESTPAHERRKGRD